MFSLLVTWDTIPHYILRLLRYASASRIRLLARHLMPVFSSSAALCVSIAPSSISPAFNAGIFFVSYVGYYPALYSLYCVRYASGIAPSSISPAFNAGIFFGCRLLLPLCALRLSAIYARLSFFARSVSLHFLFTSDYFPVNRLPLRYPCATLGLLLLVG